jgi:hypothetical protein
VATGGPAAARPRELGIEPRIAQRLGGVEIEPPVGDLAVVKGDRVCVVQLDLEIVALAHSKGMKQRDDAVTGGEQLETADLNAPEAAHQLLDHAADRLAPAVRAGRKVGVVDLGVVGVIGQHALDALAVERFQQLFEDLDVGLHRRP